MYSKKSKILNPSGLHARPASDFIRAAGKFKSEITIQKDGSDTAANAKSIIFLLSLGLCQDTEVILSAAGEDEREAVDTLAELIASGFGEL